MRHVGCDSEPPRTAIGCASEPPCAVIGCDSEPPHTAIGCDSGSPCTVIGCDTESLGGGNWGQTRIIYCVCFSDGTKIKLMCAPDAIPAPERTLIQEKLNTHTVVFTNAAHDLSVLLDCGFSVPSWEDVSLLSYCNNPNREETGHGVHSVASWGERLGYPKIKMEPWETLHEKLNNDPPPSLVEQIVDYCFRDAEITYRTFLALKDEASGRTNNHLQCVYGTYALEKCVVPLVMEMSAVGCHIDTDVLKELWDEISPRLAEMEQEMAQMVEDSIGLLPLGAKKTVKKPQERDDQVLIESGENTYTYRKLVPFNPASGTHIAYALTAMYGWQPNEFTETGAPITSASVISKLEYPLCHQLKEYAELKKLFTSFVQPMHDMAIKNDNIIRPGWKQTGTITGRFSCSDPNFQNIPSRTEFGARIRSAVVAPPGYRFVSIDLQAIEYRVFAALLSDYFVQRGEEIPSDVRFMLDAFVNGHDIHTSMAQLWFGHKPDYEERAKYYRTIGKNVSYGRMFGFSTARAAKMMGVDEDEAVRIIATADESNPSFGIFQQHVWDTLRENGGWGYTYYGRPHYYPDICLDDARGENRPRIARAQRQGFNAKIQGTAADINKLLHINVNYSVECAIAAGVADATTGIVPHFGALNVGTVHDELLFIVPNENADAFCAALTAHYKNNWNYLPHCPIDGEATHGANWREAK